MNDSMEIRKSVVVAADRDRVWRAITEPEQFSKWFGDPIQFERLAVGETITFMGEYPGTIAIVEPQTRFAFRWLAAVGYDVQNLVTFDLETVAGGTRITVTEQGFEGLPEDVRRARFEDNSRGWAIQMDNIAAYLRAAEQVRS